MQYKTLYIENFKSIDYMTVEDIETVLILVGKNNAGKSAVIDAIKIISGDYELSEYDFNIRNHMIKIKAELVISQKDLHHYYELGLVSRHKNFEKWLEDFYKRIPSFDGSALTIERQIYPDLTTKYSDGINKNNDYIEEILPRLYVIGDKRNLEYVEDALLDFGGTDQINELKDNLCLFDKTRPCNNCFKCIGLIHQKLPEEMTVFETVKLLQYKLYKINLKEFMNHVNNYFRANYSSNYQVNFDFDFTAADILKINTTIKNLDNGNELPLHFVSGAMKSLYVLSLFQAYSKNKKYVPYVIIMEEAEMHLHPQLQKSTSEVLYNLSKKNQVIFSTHSPNMLNNFSIKHIRQVRLDQEHHTIINNESNLNYILEDLGYSANDFMNVDFALIVEGKDDIKRFKSIIKRFYTDLVNDHGELTRVSLIPTHSCTNIKTYANLKYINKTYLKDNFLMIRDSDGHDVETLQRDLCSYYYKRIQDDESKIPRITPKNVLVLKYYALENYFIQPDLLAKIGLVKDEEEFFEILLQKFKAYLYNIKSGKKLLEIVGKPFETVEEVKENFELIKVVMRGHNLFDIYYRWLSKNEKHEKIEQYLSHATREHFEDVLNALETFAYFNSKKRIEEE